MLNKSFESTIRQLKAQDKVNSFMNPIKDYDIIMCRLETE